MAASGGREPTMPAQYSSSPTSLSSPPSALSEPGSPSRFLNAGRANIEMDEIIVDPGSAPRFGIMQQMQQPPPQPDVPLTAAGLPRKKPGRKPGSTVKPKPPVDGTAAGAEQPKQRRPRKPKDPNAPPIQRKRKVPPTDADGQSEDISVLSASGSAAGAQPKIRELTSMRMSLDAPRPAAPEPSHAPMAPKRDSMPASMLNILNDEPPPKPQPAPPARQMFDPVRGNYDPIRESMMSRDPYGTGPLGSPRAPTQLTNRASASPSITSLVDPQPSNNIISPSASHTSYHNNTAQPRFQESTSMPPSPSHPARSAVQAITKPTIVEARRPPPPPPAPKPEPAKTSSFTSMSTIPASAAAALSTAQAPVQSKKIAAVQQQARETHKKASSSSSSPRINGSKDSLPPIPGSERSILDFGKANPGEEISAPSIVLHIPLNGEPNKYVNFMRMAEETYGWDALHPRLAANRERKARIAAASAALEKEKNGSGRDSGDEMEEDLQSDADNSNVEMGGVGGGANGATSGADGAPAKPARKKRNFKEDEYDKDDDFVDDSELLWEEQAAASRDGFFVYSGPLIPEVPKPAASDAPPRRGRGGGRGSRGGGRGGTRGEGTGRGRGGGPGSRGGVVRKPRITKLEKEQRDKEKAERERVAQMASKAAAGPTSSPHQGVVPPPQNTAA